MKTKTFLFFCLLLGFGLTHLSGQTLQKGTVLGIHVVTFDMQPGVTMEQVEDFLVNKYFPAFNDVYEDMKIFLIKGIRGENEKKLGFIYYIESDGVRNKYWAEEGVLTEIGQEAQKKLEGLNEERGKLITNTGSVYTDWEIQ